MCKYLNISFIIRLSGVLSLFLVIGCVTFAEKKQESRFETASHTYEQALIFGWYGAAKDFSKERSSEKDLLHLNKLKKVKITSYEVLTFENSGDKSQVNQVVEIKYYNLNHMIEKSIIDKQIWRYFPDEKAWYLLSRFPDFK